MNINLNSVILDALTSLGIIDFFLIMIVLVVFFYIFWLRPRKKKNDKKKIKPTSED